MTEFVLASVINSPAGMCLKNDEDIPPCDSRKRIRPVPSIMSDCGKAEMLCNQDRLIPTGQTLGKASASVIITVVIELSTIRPGLKQSSFVSRHFKGFATSSVEAREARNSHQNVDLARHFGSSITRNLAWISLDHWPMVLWSGFNLNFVQQLHPRCRRHLHPSFGARSHLSLIQTRCFDPNTEIWLHGHLENT